MGSVNNLYLIKHILHSLKGKYLRNLDVIKNKFLKNGTNPTHSVHVYLINRSYSANTGYFEQRALRKLKWKRKTHEKIFENGHTRKLICFVGDVLPTKINQA